jgi:DNA-binding MarR family transcriptional regulator
MVHLSLEAAEKLNSLFGEVNTLATQCKQARPLFENHGDLAGGERGVLLVLGRSHSQTVPQIARTRCTSRQNIQIVVNRLKEQGLVELVTNPAHKRSAQVCLTEKGRGLFSQIELAEAQLLNEVLVDLSQDELASATKCLQKLRQALSAEFRNSNGAIPTAPIEVRPTYKTVNVGRLKQIRQPAMDDLGESNASSDEAFPVNLL